MTVGLATASSALARIRPGIEAGVNVSTLDYFHEDALRDLSIFWDNGWRPSFTGGAVVEFPIGGRFACTTGLRYVQQGNKVEVAVTTLPRVEGEFRIMQNYLAVPVLLEFHQLAASGFFLSVGPEVGFLLSGRVKSEQAVFGLGVPPTHIEESRDISNELEDVNVTIDGGAGVAFPLYSHVGIVQLRYSHGVTSPAKKDHWATDWSTQGIEFLAGMRW